MLRTHLSSGLAVVLAWAQVDTGATSGVVTDSTGAIVLGAKVTTTETDTNVQAVLSTSDAGFYSAPSLHPGPYQVEVFKERRGDGYELSLSPTHAGNCQHPPTDIDGFG